MNIAIDISPLTSGHSGRGIGVYTKQLIEALKKYEPSHTYQLITKKDTRAYSHIDMVHYPYFDPFFLTLPIQKEIPTVVTVHDLIPLVFPDKFPPGVRGKIKWWMQRNSLSKATRIITDSISSKKDIMRLIGIPEQSIDVVYLAPSSMYTEITEKTRLQALHKKYQLPEKFVLYVGDVNWNKNIDGLLQAYAQYISNTSLREKPALVLVGKAFCDETIRETREIKYRIHNLGLEKHVITVGYVTDEDLAGLYTMAACLVEPSFYEGFGLPVLEAFACGCPVVAADNSSLLEIAGPAIRVSADKSSSIASGIFTVFSWSLKEKEVMRRKGMAWAKQFTWEKTAHETVQAYERSVK